MTGSLPIPATSSLQGRDREIARLPVQLELSLGPDANHVECRIQFENTAKDHRLRWNLPLPMRPRVSRAGLKFNEVIRPPGSVPRGKRPPRVFPEYPADHYVAVETRGIGLALLAEFPFNYELVRQGGDRLAVTLLRAVELLSRNDGMCRKGGAGPDTRVPGAQCLRPFEMRFAVRPFGPGDGEGLFAEAALWRAEPLTGLIQAYDPPLDGQFQGPFVRVDDPRVVLSACKRSQDGQGRWVLRLFNPTAQHRTVRLEVAGAECFEPLGLHEQPIEADGLKPLGEGVCMVDLPPWGLRTLGPRRDNSPVGDTGGGRFLR